MKTLAKYASLVKFSHTVFAMPFALMSYVYAMVSTGIGFDWVLLLKIILCLVLARNAAMSFNRIVDREIDKANPRTASREIPSGKISAKSAKWFCGVNGALFLIVAAFINSTTGYLAPVALLIVLLYSFAKRFTWLSHIFLGLALAVAPVGAWIAVANTISVFSVILASVVVTWVGGFDIIYSLQDREFDKRQSLHSIPAFFSVRSSLLISAGLHLLSVYGVVLIGAEYMNGLLYWAGAILFTGTLIVQHLEVWGRKSKGIASSFGLFNGIASISYSVFAILNTLL